MQLLQHALEQGGKLMADLNLFEKIVEVRKAVGSLYKDKEGFGYEYVTGTQILSKVKDKMNELGLLLIPSSNGGEYREFEYTTADGVDKKDIIVWGEMSFTWIDAETQEKFNIPWSYFGQQNDASKAYGSALTYSERYFWLKVLGLPTDEDDPDAIDTTGKTSNKATYQAGKKVFKPKSSGDRTITEKQAKRLIAMARGNRSIVDSLVSGLGYDSPDEIKMGEEYDSICEQAAKLAMEDDDE